MVAIALAARHPDDVRGLVLLSGYYFPSPRLDAALFAPPAIPILGDAMRFTISPILARLLIRRLWRRLFAPREIPSRFEREFSAEMAVRPSQLRAAGGDSALMVSGAEQLQGLYQAVVQPVFLLAGAEDRAVDTDAQTARLCATLPQSDLRILCGVGHMLHHVAQSHVLGAIDRLMAPPGRGP
jgi:pimeloyl-ACP methyl ester carboxylesterase